MNNIQHLIYAYKHLSKLTLSGCFDFDVYIDVAKRKLKEAILLCVTEDDFIKHLNTKK